jgi:hypothetical protein
MVPMRDAADNRFPETMVSGYATCQITPELIPVSCSHIRKRIDKYVPSISADSAQRAQFALKNAHAGFNRI